MSVLVYAVVGAVASFVGLSIDKALTGRVPSAVWRFVISLAITMLLTCVAALLLKNIF